MIIGSPFRIRVTSMNPSGFPSTEMSKASVKYLSKKGLLRVSQEENWEENMSARFFGVHIGSVPGGIVHGL